MEFVSEHNAHCLIRMASGREIVLAKLTQRRTYADLVEGLPDQRSNDEYVQKALERAGRTRLSRRKTYLVEPERRNYRCREGDAQGYVDDQIEGFGRIVYVPEWLPAVDCMGVFYSNSPAIDPSKSVSMLTIVWFQNEFGIDPEAMARLRDVPWEDWAIDVGLY